jgi:2-oxoacid:acceptor oxidoreductase gamma subunit (pyruvate/2-ketoisovalerate family)
MIELRFHGRGGQGAVTAANILARAAVKEGKYAQAFPYFGAERRGAPVEAYARISDRPLELHSQVRSPDIVVVLDPAIPLMVDVTRGLKPGGLVLINSPGKVDLKVDNVYCVNATKIAKELGLVIGGWPVVNTAILGALVKVSNIVSMKSLEEAIAEQFREDLAKVNIEAARRAYNEVHVCKR